MSQTGAAKTRQLTMNSEDKQHEDVTFIQYTLTLHGLAEVQPPTHQHPLN